MGSSMPGTAQDEDVLIRQGFEALSQGRGSQARSIFENLAAGGSGNPLTWMLLAVCRRNDRDAAGEEAAVDRLLSMEPQSVRGLIMKGECRMRAGDNGGARQFLRTAIATAEITQLPPDILPEVERARVVLKQLDDQAHAKREALLASRGEPPDSWSPRFRQSLEIAAGRRKLYFQRPTVFTFAGLPQVQYYDPTEFAWTPAVEAATDDIRAELKALLEQRGTDDFRPYMQDEPGVVRLDTNKELVDNKEWSALFLVENGQPDRALIERCPKTWEAVSKAPLPRIPGWGPTIMFSLLKAGARINAHTGMFNTRLVCHLPLIVPPGCRFRVGNEVREWEEGKLLIFDDTIEHEAWNDGTEDRVVLIFDIWRPELSEQERRELTALFSHG